MQNHLVGTRARRSYQLHKKKRVLSGHSFSLRGTCGVCLEFELRGNKTGLDELYSKKV